MGWKKIKKRHMQLKETQKCELEKKRNQERKRERKKKRICNDRIEAP